MPSRSRLRAVHCDILTLGQYLQPTRNHLQVVEYIHPDLFKAYGEEARQMGFGLEQVIALVREREAALSSETVNSEREA